MQGLKFAILGPIEVRFGGHPVSLAGPKRRALLAFLLLNSGRIVSVDRLVDVLWGEDPPASARAQVQSLVHGVRRALGQPGAGAGAIVTAAPGYVVRPEPDQLDLLVFHRAVEVARQAADGGRPREAADALRSALELWRGPALAGVEAPFVAASAAQLEEQRLAAIEERVSADLLLGRHALLVAELASLVAENPMREQLCAQLMLALYRCGRQAEALTAYTTARELLIDRLGLEPGTELRRMEYAILTADPGLDFPPGGGGLVAPERHEPSGRAHATELAWARTGSSARPVAAAPAATPSAPAPAPRASRPWRGQPLVAAVITLLLLGVLVLVGWTTEGSGSKRAVTTGPPAATSQASQQVPGPAWVRDPPAPIPGSFYGVTLNSASGAMPTFRVGAVRLWDSRTRWSNVEPQPGEFAWEALDRLVAGAERARLPVLYTMGMTPAWASPDGPRSVYDDDSRTAPPRQISDWDRYVRAVVERYRGRIEAYELWNLANTDRFYSGSIATLVEMTGRAAQVVRTVDPAATVVCPSMGELWQPASRQFLAAFAAAGGYRHCDVAAVKLHQPRPGDRPEAIIELTRILDRTFHDAGVHLRLWNTGTTYRIASEDPLDQYEAGNFAVRFYLIGLYARYERMYFYNWGGRNLPIVLQAEGGPPTEAALLVEELEQWLAGARIRSCGHGVDDGVPANVWQCRFAVRGARGQLEEAAIRWTDSGGVTIAAEPGARLLQRLDGRSAPLRAGDDVEITERPVLIRYAPR